MTTSEFSAALTQPKWKLLLIVAVLGLGFALHERLVAPILFAVSNLWSIAPIMLAGLLVTAVLTATGSIAILVGTFNSRELSAIVMVSLIGSVLPVCGITLLPLVARLLAAGAPLAPVMAFLLSSAVIDPQMFAITAATLGLPFAIGKTVAALGIGVLGGIATWAMVRLGQFHHPMRQSSMLRSLVPQSACGGSTEVQWRFWQDPRRLTAFRDTCWSVGKLVVLFLGAAFVAEYFLKLYLPDDALTDFLGQDSLLAIPIASIIGAPTLSRWLRCTTARTRTDRSRNGPRCSNGISNRRRNYQRVDGHPSLRVGSATGVSRVCRNGSGGVDIFRLDLRPYYCVSNSKASLLTPLV